MSEHLINSHCDCRICTGSYAKQDECSNRNLSPSNCLQEFLELFPKNFPLAIINTVFPKSKNSILNWIPSKKITEHLPLATNILLFYPNKATIAYKYELVKFDPSYIYAQAYHHRIPFTVFYHGTEILQQQVLLEKLDILVKQMMNDQYYELSQTNRDFIHWIHKDYGDTIFCQFMTKLYCSFAEMLCHLTILKGQFQWIIERIGLIRLANVKDLVCQKHKKNVSFQQQYEQKIMQKLTFYDVNQIKNTNIMSKKQKINQRINAFRIEIKNMYNREKLKILEKTQKQRTLETKTKSDEVAKLFLPELYKYTSLKEVLNDEKKFKKVVLGICQMSQSSMKSGSLHKRAIQSNCPSRTKRLLAKSRKSKTEM